MEFLYPEHVERDMLEYFGRFVYTICQQFLRAASLLELLGYLGEGGGVRDPCLGIGVPPGQKYSKIPTLCTTTTSSFILRPCLGQETKYTVSQLQEFKLFNKLFQSEKSCLMPLKPQLSR